MDVIIPITGRRKSGKDTIARLGMEKFGCTGAVALSDWFKRLLAAQFKLPLENFYNEERDKPFAKPLVIRRSDISRLLSKTSELAAKYVDVRYQRLSVSKWDGRQVESIRDLMVWWANEVVSKNLGEVLHNAITAEAIKSLPRKQGKNGFDIIFVTDARQFKQSSWFGDRGDDDRPRYAHVYPLKIERPLGTFDQSDPEKAVDEFPPDYFFEVIVNDENIEALEAKVQAVLGKIRADLKRKVRPSVQRELQQPPTKAQGT